MLGEILGFLFFIGVTVGGSGLLYLFAKDDKKGGNK